MAVTLKGQTAVYEGTSTDTKPTDADNNAIFKELDTGIRYYYDGTDWNEIPRSGGGGGGGTGTDDYTDLNNKPKVNNVTVVGNLTSSDLKLQGEITSSHKLSADLVDDSASTNKFNVQADWDQTTNSAPDYIKNKPTLGTAAATDATAYATAAQGTKADNAIQTVEVNGTALTPTSAKAVNITVPTQASDINALPNTTKYAAALSLTINSSTFVMTGQLKDQNGDNLGTAQTIDLPLESVVVGGSYNSQKKKVVLTLQNGNTIEFSVADLVSGLQTELSASNKLNPAYIDYDSTHRAVSDTEKSTWDSKQNALTSTQLSAVNSGITSADVEQITTNKNNILFNTRNGVSNVLPLNSVYKRGVHADITEPSKIHFYGTPDSSGILSGLTKRMTLKEGTYTIIVNTDLDTSLNTDIYLYDMTTSDTILIIKTSGTYEFTANPTHEYLYGFYFNQGVTVDFNYQVTVRPKNSPDVGFQPYAMSNSELTEKEQANENNILLNRHYGVKNIFIPTAGNLSNPSGFTGTITRNADNSYTINGSTGGDVYYLQLGRITMPVGTFVLYARPSNKTGIFVYNDADWADNDNSRYKTFSQPTSQGIFLRIAANQTLENYTIYPMICDLTAWNMSRDYEIGALSNAKLTEVIKQLEDRVTALENQ